MRIAEMGTDISRRSNILVFSYRETRGTVQTFTEVVFWRVLDKHNYAQSSVDKVLLKPFQRIPSVRQISGKYFLHFRVHERKVAEHILVHAVNQCSVSTGQSRFLI